MSIPPASREDVLRALETFDKEYRSTDDWRDWEHKGNFRYAIEHEGKIYPVKFIIELATGHPRAYFFGGTQANGYVSERGLNVIEIDRSQSAVSIWWVNQGQAFRVQREGGFLWAPKLDRRGATPSHWKNVAEVKEGDIVVHHVHGEIIALGLAKRDAYDADRPPELADASATPWQEEGKRVDVEYFDIDPPIQTSLFMHQLAALGIDDGPVDAADRAKQGYLFRLTPEGLAVIRQHTNVDWPKWAEVVAAEPEDEERWRLFLYWGKRHHDWEKFDETERAYKLRLVKRLQIGRDALFNGDQDWFRDVKGSLSGGAHPVHWTVADNFRKWHSADPRAVARALKKLWDPASTIRERVEHFDEELPKDVIQSGGGRMSLISFLHMAMEPESFPPFRVTPVHKAYELTNFEKLHWSAPLADQYLEFLEFLDLMIHQATKIGMTIKDRLDAQGIIWAVTKWGPSGTWPEADQRAMREYLGLKVKETEGGIEQITPETTPDLSSQTTLEHLADQLLVSKESLEEIQHLLTDKRQLIFYGPPGTGKTYLAKALAEFFAMNPEDREEDGMVKIVQFHPSYAYEDFIEGYRPRNGADGVGFELVEGPLREIARAADSEPDVKHVLIIDEINRGNVAKVLGELYFLLEYRNEAISLQYSNEDFSLPPNLWIIGTMNTADRSIALIDAALRRRFYFVPFFPDEPPIEGLLRRWLDKHNRDMLWVADVVDRANELLDDRHGAIGPSYFMKEKLDEAWVERIWKHAVMPYLAEQFFGEEDRLEEFALDKLRGTNDQPNETTVDASSQP